MDNRRTQQLVIIGDGTVAVDLLHTRLTVNRLGGEISRAIEGEQIVPRKEHHRFQRLATLSKASREGDLRENMANADISASGKAISVSSVRASGMLAKPFRTKRKSASAERCLRPLGATIDIATPHVKA